MPTTYFQSNNQSILSTLITQLKGVMPGVSVVYGEEEKWDLGLALPMVVLYGDRVRYGLWENGYVQNLDPNYHITWKRSEYFKVVLWAEDPSSESTAAQDADAVHVLEGTVLQAFYALRPNGYQFQPVDGKWAIFEDAKTRRGRGYVINMMIDIPMLGVTPVEATVTSVPITDIINDQSS